MYHLTLLTNTLRNAASLYGVPITWMGCAMS